MSSLEWMHLYMVSQDCGGCLIKTKLFLLLCLAPHRRSSSGRTSTSHSSGTPGYLSSDSRRPQTGLTPPPPPPGPPDHSHCIVPSPSVPVSPDVDSEGAAGGSVGAGGSLGHPAAKETAEGDEEDTDKNQGGKGQHPPHHLPVRFQSLASSDSNEEKEDEDTEDEDEDEDEPPEESHPDSLLMSLLRRWGQDLTNLEREVVDDLRKLRQKLGCQ